MAPKKSPRLQMQGYTEGRTLRSARSLDKTIKLREGLDGDKPKAKRQKLNPPPQRAAAAAKPAANPPPVAEPEAAVAEPAANPQPGQEEGAGAEGEAAKEDNQEEGGQEKNNGRIITIEYCKQCKNEATRVSDRLKVGIPGLGVVLQEATSARKNCFEIRDEGQKVTFRSYVGVNRSCKQVKDLDMDVLIAELNSDSSAAPPGA